MSAKKYVSFVDDKKEKYYIPIDYIKYLKSFYDTGYGKMIYCIFTEIGEKNVNEDDYKSIIRKLGSDKE